MKTLILYGSRKGCTERCARKLKDELIRVGGGHCEVADVKKARLRRVSEYDHLIIGSSIWAGKLHPAVRRFMRSYSRISPSQHLGLFLCSGKEEPDYFTENFSRQVLERAEERRFFGGELSIEDFSPLMRYILRRKAGITESYRRIRDDEIQAFARNWIAGGGR